MKYIVLILLFVTMPIFAQSVSEQKYNLAETFEKSGDLDKALSIYTELVKTTPDNSKYFGAFARVMKMQNKFSDLLPFANSRLEKDESIFNLNLVAELNWRTGNSKYSNELWEKLLSKYAKESNAYQSVSQTQISLKLYDKAINTLKLGREAFANNQIYSDDLTKLYISVGDYQAGTEEVINNFYKTANLPLVQGRIYALMSSDEATKYIKNKIKDESDKNSKSIMIQELYAWFLRTNNELEDALEVYKRLDAIKNANGAELLNFANLSLSDGQYDVAIKAFNIVINYGKTNPFSSSAMYGMTRALDQRILEQKTIQNQDYDEIIGSYRRVISEYPYSQYSAQSRYRIAELAFKIKKDVTISKNELQQLLKENPPNDIASNASLMLGDIYLSEDNITESIRFYQSIALNNRFANSKDKDLAKLKLADLIFYSGNIDSSKAIYQTLSDISNSDVANDALYKISLIQANENFVESMKNYAMAELKLIQNKPDDAIMLYNKAINDCKNSDLEDLCWIKISELNFIKKNYTLTREPLEKLITSNPESIYADKIFMIIGDCYSFEGKKDEAISNYTRILAKYPDSIYLQEARKKIRILRGEKI